MKSFFNGLLALSPIIMLLVTYLSTALCVGDFYKVPIATAFILAAVYGMFLIKGKNIQQRVKIFSDGAATSDIMYMIWIFCMAGIFAMLAKSMGAVDATVALTLRLIPTTLLPVGIFVAACFISMAIGTSVGTIVALIPMVTTMATQLEAPLPWLIAIVVGGAFFGDNLSFISDTTIAATQTQGCKMSDKFKTNFIIVLPAAIFTILLYLLNNQIGEYSMPQQTIAYYKAIPYLLVIIMAITGLNVLLVLLIGIFLSAFMGLIDGSLTTLDIFIRAGEGLASISDIILVTLLAGGLMGIVKELGGFEYLVKLLTKKINSKRMAEGVIVLLIAITNLCTANNTIAILTMGPILKDLSTRYAVPPRKTAALMDTASCFIQGVLPYGAQLLMAAGLSMTIPTDIVPYLYYPMAIGVMIILSIIFQFPRINMNAGTEQEGLLKA